MHSLAFIHGANSLTLSVLDELFLSVFTYKLVFITVYLFISLFVFLFDYLSILLSACLSICLSISLSGRISSVFCLFDLLSVCLSACVSVRVFVCLAVCLSISPLSVLTRCQYICLLVVCWSSTEQEQREYEAMAHVRDSVQMVENAILERDQVLTDYFCFNLPLRVWKCQGIWFLIIKFPN